MYIDLFVFVISGVDCSWTISCAPGTVLYIEIEYSDLEYSSPCFEQILAIYDGKTLFFNYFFIFYLNPLPVGTESDFPFPPVKREASQHIRAV